MKEFEISLLPFPNMVSHTAIGDITEENNKTQTVQAQSFEAACDAVISENEEELEQQ